MLRMPAAVLGALVATADADAASAPIFPPNQICTRTDAQPMLDPLRLIQLLIAAGPITDAALDTNRDGSTLLTEKQLALAHPHYCAEIAAGCTAADEAALQRAHDDLARFVRTEGGEDYRFERLRRPTREERQGHAFLARSLEVPGQAYQIGEVLDVERRFVEIACVEPRPPALPGPIALGSGREILGWRANPERRGGFRLTSQIDDLSRNRAQLASVRPAQFSINADVEEDKTSYQVAVVAGYDFEMVRKVDRSSVIPFLQIERFFDGTTETTDKLGVGVQAVTTYGYEQTGSD